MKMVIKLDDYKQVDIGLYISRDPKLVPVFLGKSVGERAHYLFKDCHSAIIAYVQAHPRQDDVEALLRGSAPFALRILEGVHLGRDRHASQAKTRLWDATSKLDSPQRELVLLPKEKLEAICEGDVETLRDLRRFSGTFDRNPYVVRPSEVYLQIGLIPDGYTPTENSLSAYQALLDDINLRINKLGSLWKMQIPMNSRSQLEGDVKISATERYPLVDLIDLAKKNDRSTDLVQLYAGKAVEAFGQSIRFRNRSAKDCRTLH